MKKLILTALFCLGLLPAFAQFRLSGTLINTNTADTVYLNIPYVFGYYRSNNIIIPVDAKGNFKIDIKLSEQKFVVLNHRRIKTTLLLKPGRSLNLRLEPIAGGDTAIFTGTGSAENMLLYQLHLNEAAFFNRYPLEKNPYRNLTPDEVQEKVCKPILAARDKKLTLIAAAPLPAADKALIAQEVKAQAILQQLDYARTVYHFNKRSEFAELMAAIFRDVSLTPVILPAGPLYFSFANEYVGKLEMEAFAEYGTYPKVSRDKMPLKYFGVSVDSGKTLTIKNGNSYINWLAIKNNYPKTIAEPLLAQLIAEKCEEKMLSEAQLYMADLQQLYSQSAYLPGLAVSFNKLTASLAKNHNNPEIKIAEGYDQITSIYQLLPQLKGKVVYLDVWGTWCGPCKEELTYNPQLKAYFKGKDVAFVYLDMDDEATDSKWREFIKVNGLTGLHLRKNKEDIRKFWEELQPNEKIRGLYPSYFIFDKAGHLVQPDAKRPSDQTGLYKQIEQYL